jgi:hypothetical protein
LDRIPGTKIIGKWELFVINFIGNYIPKINLKITNTGFVIAKKYETKKICSRF